MENQSRMWFFLAEWHSGASLPDRLLLGMVSLDSSRHLLRLWVDILGNWRQGFSILITNHNSPICEEYKTQSARVSAWPWKRARQDNFNNTSQPMFEFQLGFILWIRQDKPTATLKGSQHAPIWNSYCGVSLEWSRWACSHDRDKPFAERNLAFNIDWRVVNDL